MAILRLKAPCAPGADNWLVRLFDYKPFLIVMCLTPALGLLLVFLTYPLGLGLWLAFTDTRRSAGPAISSGWRISISLFQDKIFWLSVFNTLVYTFVATIGEVRCSACGWRCCSNDNVPLQVADPRHRADPVDRAHGAVRDGLLVDLRSAVLDHLLCRSRT